MHKVFVSFHHANDQEYKEGLVSWAEKNKVFIDGSVDMGEIPEDWNDQMIREYIREQKNANILIGSYIQVCMMVR